VAAKVAGIVAVKVAGIVAAKVAIAIECTSPKLPSNKPPPNNTPNILFFFMVNSPFYIQK
jgi:hypothetical protein